MFGCNGRETLQPEETNVPILIESLLFDYRQRISDVMKCCDFMWSKPESIKETSRNVKPSYVKTNRNDLQ